MKQNESGAYIIDSEYNVISFNETTAELYPEMRKGEKCYKIILGRDEPCSLCPVRNKVKGQRTYFHPVRQCYVTINAVELPIQEGQISHTIIFHTLDEMDETDTDLPVDAKGLHLLSIINVLSNDISNLYEVACDTKEVTIYRFSGKAIGVEDAIKTKRYYGNAMETYIEHNVHPDDREEMRKVTVFEDIYQKLKKTDSFRYHYRILRDGETHYYYMKCARNGSAGSFHNIIMAFGCEDESIRKNRVLDVLKPGSSLRRRTILIVNDNEGDQERFRNLLQDEYDLIPVRDGKEAYELIKSRYQDIDLILLGLKLPGYDGRELLRRIKENPIFSLIPTIMTTEAFDNELEAQCMKLGADDFIVKPYEFPKVSRRVKNNIRVRDLTSSINAIEIDILTGLYTRQAFFHYAQMLLDANPDTSYSIVISDIRNFKFINRMYGEEYGDTILKSFSAFTKKYSAGGISARYGGDQFVSILPTADIESEHWLKKKYSTEFSTSNFGNIVVKEGIYKDVDHTLSVRQMCDRALLALISIKNKFGIDRICYDGPVSQKHIRIQMYETRFNEALGNREFRVFYQPKYDPYTHKIVGAEALVRWEIEGSMISPGEFLPAFEESGLIIRLDEYVFENVCAQQREWLDSGKKIVPVSVNLSRRSMSDVNVVRKYKDIAEKYGISPEYLPIEITESMAVRSSEIKPLADAFYEAGFALHMDDFGSGQSSLSELNVLHFEVLKLDKTLIDYIGDKRGDTILSYSMTLGKKLGMRLIAEGVENQRQLEFLKENGCDQVQGFYYSRPLPTEDFEKKLVSDEKA